MVSSMSRVVTSRVCVRLIGRRQPLQGLSTVSHLPIYAYCTVQHVVAWSHSDVVCCMHVDQDIPTGTEHTTCVCCGKEATASRGVECV